MLRLHYLTFFALLLLLGDAFTGVLGAVVPDDVFPDLYEASVEELQNGLEAGHFTSVDLIKVSSAQFLQWNHELRA